MRLLTIGNAKTKRGESLNILTGILHLNPSVSEKLCPFASKYCRNDCLVNSGRSEFMPMINIARTKKTEWFLNDQDSFVAQLRKDITALEKRAAKKGMRAAVRLNGTSDVIWERLIDMESFPNVQFYDYTKIPLKHRKLSRNYHLTFSFSGINEKACTEALAAGFNVAIVFEKQIPATYRGIRVIDGTLHDVRFLDNASGVYIGLCAKGKRAKASAKNGSKFYAKAA